VATQDTRSAIFLESPLSLCVVSRLTWCLWHCCVIVALWWWYHNRSMQISARPDDCHHD